MTNTCRYVAKVLPSEHTACNFVKQIISHQFMCMDQTSCTWSGTTCFGSILQSWYLWHICMWICVCVWGVGCGVTWGMGALRRFLAPRWVVSGAAVGRFGQSGRALQCTGEGVDAVAGFAELVFAWLCVPSPFLQMCLPSARLFVTQLLCSVACTAST